MNGGVGRAPVDEHPPQFAAVKVLLHLQLNKIRETEAGQGRVEDERGGVEDELPVHSHPQPSGKVSSV